MALTERLAIVLETVGANAVVKDFEKIGGAAGGLGGKAKTAGGALKGLVGLGGEAGGTLAAMNPALIAAGGAAVTFGVQAVGAYQETAQAALAMSRATGTSMEQASAMVAAFDDMGISAESGTASMAQLTKRVETSGAALASFGVTITRNNAGNVDMAATLLNVADAYKKTEDPGRRAALVNAAFGKSGAQMTPILDKGRKGIEALYAEAAKTGQIMDPADAQRTEEFRGAMDDLGDAFKKFSIVAGETIVPLATDIAGLATSTLAFVDKVLNAELPGGESWIHDLSIALNPLKSLQIQAGYSAEGLEKVTHAADYHGMVVYGDGVDAAADATGGLADASKDAAGSLDEQSAALTAVENATLGATSAKRAYDASTRSVTSAERGLVDARGKYAELLKEGRVDEEKVADARKRLNDATRSVGSAQRDLTKAQKDYNEALSYSLAVGGDDAADKLAEAADNLADKQDGVASAQERQKATQDDLKKAQAGDPDFNDKLAAAKQRVTDAEQSLADAQVTSAQQAYTLRDAVKKQTTEIAGNEAAVKSLRTEWETLLGLSPKLLPFLAAPLASLGPGGPSPGPGFGLRGFENATSPSALPTSGPVSTTTATQHINVAINSPQNADPTNLARNIAWAIR